MIKSEDQVSQMGSSQEVSPAHDQPCKFFPLFDINCQGNIVEEREWNLQKTIAYGTNGWLIKFGVFAYGTAGWLIKFGVLAYGTTSWLIKLGVFAHGTSLIKFCVFADGTALLLIIHMSYGFCLCVDFGQSRFFEVQDCEQ